MNSMQTGTAIDVEVFSDFICPWCYIGKRKLEAAAAAHGGVALRIRRRAFLLNPGMPPGGIPRKSYINAKFGAAAPAFYDRIGRSGSEAGITFRFDLIERSPDSRNAHALLAAAMQQGADTEALAENLFAAYFTRGMDIGDGEFLASLAAEHAIPFPPGDAAIAHMQADLHEAARLRIASIPYFILDGEVAISGAQPEAGFLSLFDVFAAGRTG